MDYETDDWGGGEFCDTELGVDLDSLPSPGRSVEKMVEEGMMLEGALGWLTERQREIVLLWAEGWDCVEIGRKLGISKQGVHQALNVGLDRMRAKLGVDFRG